MQYCSTTADKVYISFIQYMLCTSSLEVLLPFVNQRFSIGAIFLHFTTGILRNYGSVRFDNNQCGNAFYFVPITKLTEDFSILEILDLLNLWASEWNNSPVSVVFFVVFPEGTLLAIIRDKDNFKRFIVGFQATIKFL